MTSIEWLIKELDVDNNIFNMKIINKAKEMHKAEIIDAVLFGMQKGLNINKVPEIDSDWVNNYYQETFVSKGSDFKQFSLYEHKDTITSADTQVSKTFLESVPQQETLYTEEQVREAIFMARRQYMVFEEVEFEFMDEEIIQSLKQPKKD